jgi:hypothetical protein
VPVALTLNVVVASTAWWHYRSSGFFSWNLLAPFVISSVPSAFAGGLIQISQQLFSFLLGIALFLAAIRLLFLSEIKGGALALHPRRIWTWGVPIGGALGFLSGMIGIGGGVFLSPLLLLMRWTDAKRTAAISSGFIVLNSLSGISGHLTRTSVDWASTVPLAAATFVGGFLGSRTGALRVRPRTLQLVLAIVLMAAGTKLCSTVFGS